jgi:hypothetical protein
VVARQVHTYRYTAYSQAVINAQAEEDRHPPAVQPQRCGQRSQRAIRSRLEPFMAVYSR